MYYLIGYVHGQEYVGFKDVKNVQYDETEDYDLILKFEDENDSYEYIKNGEYYVEVKGKAPKFMTYEIVDGDTFNALGYELNMNSTENLIENDEEVDFDNLVEEYEDLIECEECYNLVTTQSCHKTEAGKYICEGCQGKLKEALKPRFYTHTAYGPYKINYFDGGFDAAQRSQWIPYDPNKRVRILKTAEDGSYDYIRMTLGEFADLLDAEGIKYIGQDSRKHVNESVRYKELNEKHFVEIETYLKSGENLYLDEYEYEYTNGYSFGIDIVSAELTYDSNTNDFTLYLNIYHASKDNNGNNPERYTEEEQCCYKSIEDIYDEYPDFVRAIYWQNIYNLNNDESLNEASYEDDQDEIEGDEDDGWTTDYYEYHDNWYKDLEDCLNHEVCEIKWCELYPEDKDLLYISQDDIYLDDIEKIAEIFCDYYKEDAEGKYYELEAYPRSKRDYYKVSFKCKNGECVDFTDITLNRYDDEDEFDESLNEAKLNTYKVLVCDGNGARSRGTENDNYYSLKVKASNVEEAVRKLFNKIWGEELEEYFEYFAEDKLEDPNFSVWEYIQTNFDSTGGDPFIVRIKENDNVIYKLDFDYEEDLEEASDVKKLIKPKRDEKGRFKGIRPLYDKDENISDYDRIQLKAYNILKLKRPYAVIYAYDQGNGKVLLNPPLEKRSQEEVQDFVDSFKTGNQAVRVVVDVFNLTELKKIEYSLRRRNLIQ